MHKRIIKCNTYKQPTKCNNNNFTNNFNQLNMFRAIISHRRCYLQAASWVHYTTSCKHSLVLLRMGEIIARNMLSWLKLPIKLLLLQLVGCLYYCISDARSHKHQTLLDACLCLPCTLIQRRRWMTSGILVPFSKFKQSQNDRLSRTFANHAEDFSVEIFF